jgi:hypothetical protein
MPILKKVKVYMTWQERVFMVQLLDAFIKSNNKIMSSTTPDPHLDLEETERRTILMQGLKQKFMRP